MATPVGFAVLSANLTVQGSSKVFTITLGAGGSGGISAAVMGTAWKNALTASDSSPFNSGNMDTAWTLIETKCVKALAGGALDIFTDTSPLVGAATISTPSPNISVLVHKSTGMGGRRYRGRMSVPPCNISEADVSKAGFLESTAYTTQQEYWNYVKASLSSSGTNPYLLHYPTTLPDGGDFPPPPTAISQLNVAQLVGSNGSRLR